MDEDNLIRPADFTREREKIGVNWRVREGLHGLVGRLRIPGTALIVEDVCVPPARIAEAAKDIQALLGEHGFLTGVAGHTSAGNLHFMLTPDFAKQEDLDRYEAFMEGLVATRLSTSTTARSRPSTAPASTWRPTSRASGASRRLS